MRVIAIYNDRTEIFENVESIEVEDPGVFRIDEMGGISPDTLIVLPEK